MFVKVAAESIASMTTDPYLMPAPADWSVPWQIIIDGRRTDGRLLFGEARMPPRTAGPHLHIHTREDESLYIIDGTLTVQVGGEIFDAKAGQAVWLPRDIPHTFANRTEATVRIVGATAPGGLEGMFAEQAAYFASLNGPPDETVIAEIGERYGVSRVGPPLGMNPSA